MKFNICPNCGAHLDFGEQCDCLRKREAEETKKGGEQSVADKPAPAGGTLSRGQDRAVGV